MDKRFRYYGVALNGFDVLDFAADILAGVRTAYFGTMQPQYDRGIRVIDGHEYSFAYSMENGKSLMWKVLRDGAPFQSAEMLNDSYRVITYDGFGTPSKCMYFDFEHNWLKTEYLDNSGNFPEAVLQPKEVDGEQVVFYESSGFDVVLSPSFEPPTENEYSVLVYSDLGFIYFYTEEKICSAKEIQETVREGFDFIPEDFTTRKQSDFSLNEAEYLTMDNGNPRDIPEEDITVEDVPEKEPEELTEEIFSEKTEEQESFIHHEKIEPDEQESFTHHENTEPDLEISSHGINYHYYGELSPENKREGRGRTVTEEGVTAYEGGYKNDMRDGFGAFYYKNGELNYVGNWSENRRQGFGVGLRGSDGTAHIGKWDNNYPDGIGARFDREGNFLFLGRYENGKKHGKCITLDDDGSFVLSEFKDDEVISSVRIDDLLKNDE